MKTLGSAVSFAAHVAVGAALLLGTTKTGQSDPRPPRTVPVVFQPATAADHDDGPGGLSTSAPITVPPLDFRSIPSPPTLGHTETLMQSFSPTVSAHARSGNGQLDGWSAVLTEEHAEVLTGPLPVYPELLRQAGVQGKVILEAVVDTTGRVLAPSILVVAATNPGFVAPARQALVATLFRPATVGGRPVRMRVRIPYEFAIRNGTGHAR
jgi:protein TonB